MLRAFSVTVAPIALSGCVALAGTEGYRLNEAGFDNVSHYARQATGKETVWVQNRAEAQAVARRVSAMIGGKTISADVAVQVALLNNKGLQAAYAGVGEFRGRGMAAVAAHQSGRIAWRAGHRCAGTRCLSRAGRFSSSIIF